MFLAIFFFGAEEEAMETLSSKSQTFVNLVHLKLFETLSLYLPQWYTQPCNCKSLSYWRLTKQKLFPQLSLPCIDQLWDSHICQEWEIYDGKVVHQYLDEQLTATWSGNHINLYHGGRWKTCWGVKNMLGGTKELISRTGTTSITILYVWGKGTDGLTKTDEFLEKIETALSPPPSFSENHVAIFFQKTSEKPI